jgi:hypothetical protein
MTLMGQVLSRDLVSASRREEMFALMDRYYEGVDRGAFFVDMDEKHWVIVLRDLRSDAVCGFSTQMLLDVDVGGRAVKAVFSGDTIIAPEHWGDNTLARLWGRLALRLIEELDSQELYWFLISKGYKTYRFLPLFFHEFYPRHETKTPPWAQDVIHSLGRYKYPALYDAAHGVIRATDGKDRLRAEVAPLTAARLRDPHVRFFATRNPGHARGEELCCIAPLTRANFTSAAYRVIGSENAARGLAV